MSLITALTKTFSSLINKVLFILSNYFSMQKFGRQPFVQWLKTQVLSICGSVNLKALESSVGLFTSSLQMEEENGKLCRSFSQASPGHRIPSFCPRNILVLSHVHLKEGLEQQFKLIPRGENKLLVEKISWYLYDHRTDVNFYKHKQSVNLCPCNNPSGQLRLLVFCR